MMALRAALHRPWRVQKGIETRLYINGLQSSTKLMSTWPKVKPKRVRIITVSHVVFLFFESKQTLYEHYACIETASL